MRFDFVFVAQLATLGAAVAAKVADPVTSRCYTGYGSQTAADGVVPTSTKTSYTPCTVTATITHTVTSSARSKVTSTATVTATTSGVTTIAAPAGFSPIADTLPGATNGPEPLPQPSTPAKVKRDHAHEHRHRATGPMKARPYATAVECVSWEPSSRCSTTTQTVTRTVVKSTKHLPTTTVTTTHTTTTYTSAAYAACQGSNIANQVPVNGAPCYFDNIGQDAYLEAGEDYNAAEGNVENCCIFAVTDPHDTVNWIFYVSASDAQYAYCYAIVTESTCPTNQSTNAVSVDCEYSVPASFGQEVFVGNGYCGSVTSADVVRAT